MYPNPDWVFGPEPRPFRVKQQVLDDWQGMLIIDGERQSPRVVKLKLGFWILNNPEVLTAHGGRLRDDWRRRMNSFFGVKLVNAVNQQLRVY